MPAAVARQEHDPPAGEAANAVGVGGIAEGRADFLPGDVAESLELVQPTPTDDSDGRFGDGLRGLAGGHERIASGEVGMSSPTVRSLIAAVRWTRTMSRTSAAGPGNATST